MKDVKIRTSAAVVSCALVSALMATSAVAAPKAPAAKPVAAKSAAKSAPVKPAVKSPKASSAKASDVVAKVGDDVITKSEVADQILDNQIARLKVTDKQFADTQRASAGFVGALVLQKMGKNGGKPVTVSRNEIVDFLFADKPQVLYSTIQNIIVERVVARAGKQAGVTVPASELAAQFKKSVDQARKGYHLEGKSDEQVLATFGMRSAYLQEIVKTQSTLKALVTKDLEKKAGHPLGAEDFVKASHILVAVTPKAAGAPGANGEPATPTKEETDKADAEAKAKIDAILADIKAGKTTFEKAASENNEGDSSKMNGGSLGVFMRGSMVAPFDKVAFSLAAGKLSDPVRTQFGYHIIRVDTLGKDLPKPEREKAIDNAVQTAMRQKVSDLMMEAQTKNLIKNNYTAPQPPMMPMGPQGGGE